MRITGSRMLALAAQATSRNQGEVAEISDQLSSGKTVDRPSDDPVAWAQARRAEIRRVTSEGRGASMGLGKDQLAESEQALTTIADIMAESQALAVQAANDSNGPAERAAIGLRVAGLYQAALAAANTRNVAGEYVLAGSATSTAPFDAAGNYVGDAVVRELEIDDGATAPSAMTGARLTTVGGGFDVLPMLSQFAAALNSNNAAAIQQSVGDLSGAHAQVVEARGEVGAMFNVLDQADHARATLEDTMTARVADLTETDVIRAASELVQRSTALSASQAINARLAALLSPAR